MTVAVNPPAEDWRFQAHLSPTGSVVIYGTRTRRSPLTPTQINKVVAATDGGGKALISKRQLRVSACLRKQPGCRRRHGQGKQVAQITAGISRRSPRNSPNTTLRFGRNYLSTPPIIWAAFTSFTYDGLNSGIKSTDALGNQNPQRIRRNGNQVTRQDALGRLREQLRWAQSSDRFHRTPWGSCTHRTYDELGTLVTLTPRNGTAHARTNGTSRPRNA